MSRATYNRIGIVLILIGTVVLAVAAYQSLTNDPGSDGDLWFTGAVISALGAGLPYFGKRDGREDAP